MENKVLLDEELGLKTQFKSQVEMFKKYRSQNSVDKTRGCLLCGVIRILEQGVPKFCFVGRNKVH